MNQKRELKGVVVSDKMKKTRVVQVTNYKLHPKYKKRFSVTRKYYAHDEKEGFKMGDTVTIREARPLSKLKRWIVVYDTEKKDSKAA